MNELGGLRVSSWWQRGFAYGVGTAVGRWLFGDEDERRSEVNSAPIRQQTEEEILADERRYDEDEKRIEEEARAERAARKRGAAS